MDRPASTAPAQHDLSGKVALVTGSTRGIGLTITRLLASSGASVAMCARTINDTARTSLQSVRILNGEAHLYRADVSKPVEVSKLFDDVHTTFGRIDILVNNAGTVHWKSLMETTTDEWTNTIETNLGSAFRCTQEFARICIPQGTGGSIVNISSRLAFRPQTVTGAYCVAKAGLNMLTNVTAIELAPFDITVNSVAPGLVKTELTSGHVDALEEYKDYLNKVPLRRLPETNDIADAVLYLLSPAARTITGQTIVIDGGRGLV